MIVRALACAFLSAVALGAPPQRPERVLFIGNSLTLANGLGAMVEALAREAGDVPIETRTVAVGGFSLEDHWTQGDARRVLAAGGWTTVVLQQGPSTRPASEALLREFVRRFAGEAARIGASTAILMAWPPRAGPGTIDDSSRSHRRAAADVGALLLPVGEAFRVALESSPRLEVLSSDGFHPSPLGTYLAAIVIHRALSHRAAPFVPAELTPSGDRRFPAMHVSPDTITLLRAAAAAS